MILYSQDLGESYQRLAKKQLIYRAPSFGSRMLACFRPTATQGGAQGAEMTKSKHDPEHAGDAASTICGVDSNSIDTKMAWESRICVQLSLHSNHCLPYVQHCRWPAAVTVHIPNYFLVLMEFPAS